MRTIPEVVENIKNILNNAERTQDGECLVEIDDLVNEILVINSSNKNNCECEKVTIKDYADMPRVEIDGKLFVDRDIFVGYAINLLQQEINDKTTIPSEKLGLEIAVNIIGNIK